MIASPSPSGVVSRRLAFFKGLADRKKHIYDADIVALVDDEAGSVDDRIKLLDMEVVSKTGGVHRCEMTVVIDGETEYGNPHGGKETFGDARGRE